MKLINGEPMSEEDIVVQYKNMVYKLAHRYKRHARAIGVDFEDIVQEGFIGLVNSYRQFDSKKDVKFITYSFDIVKYAILHHLRDYRMVKTPRHLRMLYLQLFKTNITDAEPEEMACLLDVPLEDVKKAIFYNSSTYINSLNQTIKNKHTEKDENCLNVEHLQGTRDDLTNVYTDLLFKDLDNRLSFVLRERLSERSQPQIAKTLNCSQPTVFRYLQEIRDIYLTNHA